MPKANSHGKSAPPLVPEPADATATPEVIDDLPAHIPLAVAEIDVIDVFIGQLLDQLLDAQQTIASAPNEKS